jgi:hypothetical protein
MPPLNLLLGVLAAVLFTVSAYLSTPVEGKLTNLGLAVLTLALLWR